MAERSWRGTGLPSPGDHPKCGDALPRVASVAAVNPHARRAHSDVARSAYDRALALLVRRERSDRELRMRLERAGYDEEDSDAALARLRAQHYQDDGRFGEMIVRTRVGQGYGPARIRAELRSHGLADDAIQELLDAADVDWDALAAAQARKQYGAGPAPDRATRDKRAAYLVRRGFSSATARIVTHSGIGDSTE